jgi:hypothetical protein
MLFRGRILGKSKPSVKYTVERHVICKLFCVKASFSTVKSAESYDFLRIILRKNMPLRRITSGKSKF